MSKITLGEAVFNNGMAGVVAGCTVRFEKRKSTDPTNQPIYKLIAVDPNTGGEINKGFFYNDKFPSKAQENFFKNEMTHLLRAFEVKNPRREFDTYREMLDYVIQSCRENNSEEKTFYIVADYGTLKWPKRFLQLNGYPWYIMPSDGGREPSLRDDALTERPTPDGDQGVSIGASTEDSAPAVDNSDEWID